MKSNTYLREMYHNGITALAVYKRKLNQSDFIFPADRAIAIAKFRESHQVQTGSLMLRKWYSTFGSQNIWIRRVDSQWTPKLLQYLGESNSWTIVLFPGYWNERSNSLRSAKRFLWGSYTYHKTICSAMIENEGNMSGKSCLNIEKLCFPITSFSTIKYVCMQIALNKNTRKILRYFKFNLSSNFTYF